MGDTTDRLLRIPAHRQKGTGGYGEHMSEFAYSDLLPTGPDTTEYRLITAEGVDLRSRRADVPEGRAGGNPRLDEEAMHDIAHYLRTEHLEQLASILADPEASPNDTFVATELLRNANIAAAGVLPCQDTGTAIVMAKKGERVVTFIDDAEAISRGVHDTYTETNLRYSQLAPISMFEEKNTGNNLPAQIELYSKAATAMSSCSWRKVVVRPTSRSSSRRPRPCSTRRRWSTFSTSPCERSSTSACPPYRLALVVGGTSAEFALKTGAHAHYLDSLPTSGDAATGHGYRTSSGNKRFSNRPGSSASGPNSAASTSATTFG